MRISLFDRAADDERLLVIPPPHGLDRVARKPVAIALEPLLQARLPKMKKADVDRAVRKYISLHGLTIAIVADKAQVVADTLTDGGPTGIAYDTAGTPPDVVAEDNLIKRFPLPIEKADVRVVPVDQMFEK